MVRSIGFAVTLAAVAKPRGEVEHDGWLSPASASQDPGRLS